MCTVGSQQGARSGRWNQGQGKVKILRRLRPERWWSLKSGWSRVTVQRSRQWSSERTPHICEGDQGGRGEGQSLRSRSGSRQRRGGSVLKVSVWQSKMFCDSVDQHSLPVIEPLPWARCWQHSCPFHRDIRPAHGKQSVMWLTWQGMQ